MSGSKGLVSGIYMRGRRWRKADDKEPERRKREHQARRRAVRKAMSEAAAKRVLSKEDYAAMLRTQPTESEFAFGIALRARFDPLGFNFRASVPVQGYIADFYCERARLVVELDGHFHKKRKEYDRLRDKHLQYAGIRTLRFPSARVFRDTEGILNEIAEALL